jgi:CRISPR system Cascade subunit CasE
MPMFLSRLILDLYKRRVRRELDDAYEMHRTILRAFPSGADGGPGRVMFRVEQVPGAHLPAVLVQSSKEPNWSRLPEEILAEPAKCKSLNLAFRQGQSLTFRLRANPTMKRDSKRLGLLTEGQQRDWLHRKGLQGGFRPGLFQATKEGVTTGHKGAACLTHLAVRFDGLLTVTDPSAFAQTVENGVGSAKSFGFGLLSLAPA